MHGLEQIKNEFSSMLGTVTRAEKHPVRVPCKRKRTKGLRIVKSYFCGREKWFECVGD